jgi:hypothetical protein
VQLIGSRLKTLEVGMLFLAAGPDITPITELTTTWIRIGQALVGSVGALAFIGAFARMPQTQESGADL